MTAIGRALMARPKVILLDEPSMGLAPQLVEEIFEIVARLNARGRRHLPARRAEHQRRAALRQLRLHPGERAGGARRRRRGAAQQRGRQGILPRPVRQRAQELPRHQELQAPQALALGTSTMIGSRSPGQSGAAHRLGARRGPAPRRAREPPLDDGRIRRVSDLLIDGIADQPAAGFDRPDPAASRRIPRPRSRSTASCPGSRRPTSCRSPAGSASMPCSSRSAARPACAARRRISTCWRCARAWRSRSRCAASSISAGASPRSRRPTTGCSRRRPALEPWQRLLAAAARQAVRLPPRRPRRRWSSTRSRSAAPFPTA